MSDLGFGVRRMSQHTVWRHHFDEGSGSFLDVSGNGFDVVPQAGAVNPYANAGWLTTDAVTDGRADIDLSGVAAPLWDLRYDVAIWSVRLIASALAAVQNLAGNYDASTQGFGSRVASNDLITVQVNRGSLQDYAMVGQTVGSAQHVLAIIDGPAQLLSAWVDGANIRNEDDISAAGSGSGWGGGAWSFGSRNGAGASFGAQFQAEQLIVIRGTAGDPAAPPRRLAELARMLNANPYYPISDADLD